MFVRNMAAQAGFSRYNKNITIPYVKAISEWL